MRNHFFEKWFKALNGYVKTEIAMIRGSREHPPIQVTSFVERLKGVSIDIRTDAYSWLFCSEDVEKFCEVADKIISDFDQGYDDLFKKGKKKTGPKSVNKDLALFILYYLERNEKISNRLERKKNYDSLRCFIERNTGELEKDTLVELLIEYYHLPCIKSDDKYWYSSYKNKLYLHVSFPSL